MSNAEQCKDCNTFNRLRETNFGTCLPVAKYLHGSQEKTPILVTASFGCVLWEEKKCEEVYVPTIKKLDYSRNIVGTYELAIKIDEIIDHLNNRS